MNFKSIKGKLNFSEFVSTVNAILRVVKKTTLNELYKKNYLLK